MGVDLANERHGQVHQRGHALQCKPQPEVLVTRSAPIVQLTITSPLALRGHSIVNCDPFRHVILNSEGTRR